MANAICVEGTTGFYINIPISGAASLSGATNQKLYVMVPGATEEAEWDCAVDEDNLRLRHLVPEARHLVAGYYKIQPYFELGDFKGRWGAVLFPVEEKQTLRST